MPLALARLVLDVVMLMGNPIGCSGGATRILDQVIWYREYRFATEKKDILCQVMKESGTHNGCQLM